MKVLQVITALIKSSGVSVFCGELARELVKQGHDVKVYARYRLPEEYDCEGCGEIVSSIEALGDWRPDVIHLNGIWDLPLFRVFLWARRQKIPVTWSPHGSLTQWALAYHWLKKKVAWHVYQKWGLKRAGLIHVTGTFETPDIRRLHLKNPVVEAPLGISVPEVFPTKEKNTVKTALFLSRVHPKKGLFNLIDAWAEINPEGWQLLIAGPSEVGHIEEVMQRAKDKGLTNVISVGEVGGVAKDKLYADADLFVLPSYSENFGSVVIEALAQGTPVITTKGTPWEDLETYHCGWWIEIGVDPLVQALRTAMALSDEERQAMGRRGFDWVCKEFSWESVTIKMVDAYTWLIGQGDKPDCVKLT